MAFNSVVFIYYFLPAAIVIFYLVKKWPQLQNLWLLMISFLFYAWCNMHYLLFLVIFGLINFWFGKVLALCSGTQKAAVKHVVLIPAISLNLLCLFVVKYYNFSVSAANRFLKTNLSPIESIIIPLGISFLVFSMISYLVDVYRNRIQPLHKITDFFLYLSFFPKVSQGPITRCEEFESCLHARSISIDQFCQGVRRFSFGLAKKVLIADTLGRSVDLIFSNIETGITPSTAWIGMLCYTFQIYYDFSGYTDMAIGIGSLFSFHLPENFNAPYLSKSVSEFWRRWHITLGAWFREYVYIPMGGNRRGVLQTYLNLAVVWILTGIWHGAAYTYILWGIVIGFVIILEKQIAKKNWYRCIPSCLKWFGTFLFIMLTWVLFRCDTLGNAKRYFLTLFDLRSSDNIIFDTRYFIDIGTLLALVTAMIRTIPMPGKLHKWIQDSACGLLIQNIAAIILLSLALLFMVNSTYNAFIYFQF